MPIDADPAWTLDRMTEFERAIGALYAAYAQEIPEHSGFWKKLAAEEEEHASWLESFPDFEEAGLASIQSLRFSMREIEEGLDFVQAESVKAVDGTLTHDRALEIALLIERSILERQFYKVVGDPSEAARKLLESLAEGAREHLLRIEAERKK